jgi:NAD(P)-dependent dehydrogenase (short-subunit alcohol dehydrogenase family)
MKTALITGGNSGIGKAAASGLAKLGYNIIIHGKDLSKTIQAVNDIKTISGNNQVDYIVSDISNIMGIKELAEKVKQKTNSIHALVLSTGVILPTYHVTADGLEEGFVVQYLSRFGVTYHLMNELKNGKAKIIHVAAPVLKNATIFFDDIALKTNFSMMKAMAQEMFSNHLFTQEFARRNPDNGIVMNMAHPGIVKTGILRNSNFLLRGIVNTIGKSPEAASKNILFLANDDKVTYSGYFLKKPGNPEIKEKIQYDPVIAQKLWDKSLELIGVIH